VRQRRARDTDAERPESRKVATPHADPGRWGPFSTEFGRRYDFHFLSSDCRPRSERERSLVTVERHEQQNVVQKPAQTGTKAQQVLIACSSEQYECELRSNNSTENDICETAYEYEQDDIEQPFPGLTTGDVVRQGRHAIAPLRMPGQLVYPVCRSRFGAGTG
jgi:hypothetical protein